MASLDVTMNLIGRIFECLDVTEHLVGLLTGDVAQLPAPEFITMV